MPAGNTEGTFKASTYLLTVAYDPALTVLEAFVATSLASAYILSLFVLPGGLSKAEKEAGPIISRTPAIIGPILWIQGILCVGPPFVYILGVCFNGFIQPDWMQDYGLPSQWAHEFGGYAVIRLIGALTVAVMLPAGAMACSHALGSQYALIGVR
jgi:hypothetical protein